MLRPEILDAKYQRPGGSLNTLFRSLFGLRCIIVLPSTGTDSKLKSPAKITAISDGLSIAD